MKDAPSVQLADPVDLREVVADAGGDQELAGPDDLMVGERDVESRVGVALGGRHADVAQLDRVVPFELARVRSRETLSDRCRRASDTRAARARRRCAGSRCRTRAPTGGTCRARAPRSTPPDLPPRSPRRTSAACSLHSTNSLSCAIIEPPKAVISNRRSEDQEKKRKSPDLLISCYTRPPRYPGGWELTMSVPQEPVVIARKRGSSRSDSRSTSTRARAAVSAGRPAATRSSDSSARGASPRSACRQAT